MTTYITWVLFAISICGVLLNLRKSRWCFLLWTISGLSWATWAACVRPEGWTGLLARECVFSCLAVYGLWKWGRK